MSSFGGQLRQRLDALRAAELLRNPRTVASDAAARVKIDGRELLCFCSNNYLGLASDERLRRALAEGASLFGAGSGASRLISGTHESHRRAEGALAAWVGTESALLFSTGYAANVGTIQALVGKGDLVVSDALNHASLIDGCRLSGATVRVVPHNDVEAVQQVLKRERASFGNALVATESVFSMEGDLADLVALRAICDEFDAGLYVDEAHAVGVFGPEGAGAAAMFHVKPDVLVGTLGKALGLAGAFVAGSADLRSVLENRARSYVFSTAPPAMLAHATLAAVDLVKVADASRAKVRSHSLRLRAGLRELGYEVPSGETPIVPLQLGAPQKALAMSEALFERGIFVQAIRPPTVPEGTSRLRIAPMATHSDEEIGICLDAFDGLAP